MEETIPADEAADEDAVAEDAVVEEEEDKEEGHRAQIMLIEAAVALCRRFPLSNAPDLGRLYVLLVYGCIRCVKLCELTPLTSLSPGACSPGDKTPVCRGTARASRYSRP